MDAVFSDWASLPLDGGWSDTFIFKVSSQACLPPYAYAPLLKRLTTAKIRTRRQSMSLWVQVEAPGEWFGIELRQALRGLRVPCVVTNGSPPDFLDFSCPPWLGISPGQRPPEVENEPKHVPPDALLCLRALGRMLKGDEAEIASLTSLDEAAVQMCLAELEQKKMVVFKTGRMILRRKSAHSKPDPKPLWHLTRPGLSYCLRSWGVPRNTPADRRQERNLSQIGYHHRHIARLWPAWLKAAWPQAEIWAGWSEVGLPKTRVIPDGLAWGRLDGYETLFWLEVGDDHKDRSKIEGLMRLRFNAARQLCKRTGVRLVFALLCPNWVGEAALRAFSAVPGDMAVAIGDWREFGKLPAVEWGRAIDGL
jgi:hypothetical protein